jgi:hypothetical protein
MYILGNKQHDVLTKMKWKFLIFGIIGLILLSNINIVDAAVTLGTSAGFVNVSPSSDPGGGLTIMDNTVKILLDRTPLGVNKITEVGWWCDAASEAANYEVGLYLPNGTGGMAGTLIYSSITNAKGTTSGWKKVTVDWTISSNTTYWIAVQLDDTATATYLDYSNNGPGRSQKTASTLPSPYGTGSSDTWYVYAMYALVTSASASAPVVNIMNSSFNTTDTTPDVFFNYTSGGSTGNCSLYFNNTVVANNASVLRNTMTKLTSSVLGVGNYYVNVSCNSSNLLNWSSTIQVNITAPPAGGSCSCPQNASTAFSVSMGSSCNLTGDCLCGALSFSGSGSFNYTGGFFNYSSISFNVTNSRFVGSNTLWKKR